MKFNSGREMFDYINSDMDLYSPFEEIYVFKYTDNGSICTYTISNEHAKRLKKMDGYWGGHLGWGGQIFDSEEWYKENKENILDGIPTAEQWCDMVYNCCDDWEDVTQ